VIDGAEVVRDAVLAPMSHEEHMDVAELTAAVSTGPRRALGDGIGVQLAGLPMGSLDRPGDDVLETTEHRPAIAGRLIEAKAVVVLDAGSAPGAFLGCHAPK
jgi:hypothetical protein